MCVLVSVFLGQSFEVLGQLSSSQMCHFLSLVTYTQEMCHGKHFKPVCCALSLVFSFWESVGGDWLEVEHVTQGSGVKI